MRLWMVLLPILLAGVAGAQESQQRERPERRIEPPRAPSEAPRPKLERKLERSAFRDPSQTRRTRGTIVDTPSSPPPPELPVMPRSSWLPEEWNGYVEQLVLECRSLRVCDLDPLDAYAAWMIAAQTTFPWRAIVDARVSAPSWAAAFERLGVRPWEVYAAFDQRTSGPRLPGDLLVRQMAERHLGAIVPPDFPCRVPVVLEGISAEEIDRRSGDTSLAVDWIDDGIAERIAEETGWCKDDLLDARRFLGSWPRVARNLYLSPFLFESSFGIELAIQPLGSTQRARYPLEEEIRHIVETDQWPEERR